jgi:hypothetical protein
MQARSFAASPRIAASYSFNASLQAMQSKQSTDRSIDDDRIRNLTLKP